MLKIHNSDTDSTASSLFSSSGDEKSLGGRSGALQEIFEGLSLVQPSAVQNWESLFAKADSSECIVFDASGKLIAATVTKLVERLTTVVGIAQP
jgi:hypothetical protein